MVQILRLSALFLALLAPLAAVAQPRGAPPSPAPSPAPSPGNTNRILAVVNADSDWFDAVSE